MAVAFTTPALKYARLRITASGNWEAMLPGLSGSMGTYILPWFSLPEMVSFSLHDRALFDLVKTPADIQPPQLRRHLLSVQAEGYDGPDRALAAQDSLDREEEAGREIHYILIERALKQFGSDSDRSITADQLSDPNVMACAHQSLDVAKGQIGMIGEHVVATLRDWSDVILPIGLDQPQVNGYVMDQLQAIAAFTAELQEWASEESSSTAAMAGQISDAVSMSGRLAMETAEKLHMPEQNIRASLKNWPETRKMIRHLVHWCCWLLDGWPRLLDQWQREAEAPRFRQRELVAHLIQNLPVLPQEALSSNQMVLWANYRKNQKNWATLSLHGAPEEIDPDLQEMLDAFPVEEG
ncbi:hypothetical protein [Aestuariispira insulae]|uniref:hypothetical protein n=1 Tax=Aestuariispira insulae TaxID=1461337 RepID=UPI001C3FCD31|nr:hypothetical protein [Aestuariispira insulae]